MSGDPPMSYLVDQLQENADSQKMTVYCSFCPEWQATGTAKETREAAEDHRAKKHPELRGKQRLVRKRRVFSQSMSEEREIEIEEERRRRMRALGIAWKEEAEQ